jgi:ribonuclease HII
MARNRCYYALQNVLKSKTLSQKAKLNLYKTIIRHIVTYGSKTWTLTKKDESQINTWERKVLRRIFGPVKTEGYGE